MDCMTAFLRADPAAGFAPSPFGLAHAPLVFDRPGNGGQESWNLFRRWGKELVRRARRGLDAGIRQSSGSKLEGAGTAAQASKLLPVFAACKAQAGNTPEALA